MECTETPLKAGMSEDMSGDCQNERKYEQIRVNERQDTKRLYIQSAENVESGKKIENSHNKGTNEVVSPRSDDFVTAPNIRMIESAEMPDTTTVVS